jgi:MOSC domain-containing protein YiiM
MRFEIEAVCVSDQKGTQKHAVENILLIKDFGIEKDAHAGPGIRQVSFLAGEEIDILRSEGLSLEHGAFGENIVTRGIDWTITEVGRRIIIGEIELEITQKGKECHTPCIIQELAGRCIMPEKSVFARVIKGGLVHAGSSGNYSIR